MLILTRCPDETLMVDLAPRSDPEAPIGTVFAAGPLVITVTAVRGPQVKLGVSADRRLRVLRGELQEKLAT
ncbi:MAG: carbon storage regulator [Acidiferrobacterales bacterium]